MLTNGVLVGREWFVTLVVTLAWVTRSSSHETQRVDNLVSKAGF